METPALLDDSTRPNSEEGPAAVLAAPAALADEEEAVTVVSREEPEKRKKQTLPSLTVLHHGTTWRKLSRNPTGDHVHGRYKSKPHIQIKAIRMCYADCMCNGWRLVDCLVSSELKLVPLQTELEGLVPSEGLATLALGRHARKGPKGRRVHETLLGRCLATWASRCQASLCELGQRAESQADMLDRPCPGRVL